MKTAIAILAVCLVAAPPLFSAPSRDEQRSGRAAIQAQYDRFNASLAGKNVAALAQLCAADCKFKTRPDGPAISLDEFRQTRLAGFKSMSIRRARTRIDSFTADGDTAHVKATWTADLASGSASGPAGRKPHHVHSVQKLEDSWTRSPRGWLLQSSVVTSTQTEMDHRPNRD